MPSRPNARSRPPAWALGLLVFGVTLATYWPSLHGGVLWDDPAHLTIPDLRSWSGLWRLLTQLGTTQEYYPVLHGAFWVEHRLWGDYLPGYHLLNVALHAGSACLVALILGRLWQPVTGAGSARRVPAGTEWVVALLFAVHPVAVESVAWITEQKNTLSLFLFLAAGLLYLNYEDNRRATAYGLATAAFILALGAKTATFTLPPALLVVAWWRCGRLDWRRHVRPLLPWFALAVVAGLVTVKVETNFVGAKGAAYALTFGERLLLAPRIVWFYVEKNIWPHELLFFYPRWDVPAQAAGWWGYAAATLLMTALCWRVRRRTRGPLAAWLLFLGTMFPVIGFFNVFAFLFSYVADHFQYMPCLMFVAGATGTVAAALSPRALRLAGVAAGALALAWAVESHALSARYVNNETLFRHVVARNPDSWIAHQILGVDYARAGRSAAAIAEYREVIRLHPAHPDAYFGLALELNRTPAHRAEVVALFERALQLRPQYLEAHYQYALLLAEDSARRADAIAHLEVAVALKPNFAAAQAALGTLLVKDPATTGRGMTCLQTALQLEPDNGALHRAYGDALARTRRSNEAIGEYQAALQLNDRDALAQFHLADVFTSQRQFEAAVPHYETALQLDPSLAPAHAHLSRILALQPARRAEALQHAEAAVQLAPGDVESRNLLAMLCAEAGDLERARQEWEAALRIDPGYGDARQNLQRLEQMQRR